jgi:hypothetical protein
MSTLTLDGDRHTVQRTHRASARQHLIGRGGLGERLLVPWAYHRVEMRIDRVEPGQGVGRRLAAGDLAGANQGGQLGRGQSPEGGGYGRSPGE